MTVPIVAQSKSSHYRHWKTSSKITYTRYRYWAQARKGRKRKARGGQEGPGKGEAEQPRREREGAGEVGVYVYTRTLGRETHASVDSEIKAVVDLMAESSWAEYVM